MHVIRFSTYAKKIEMKNTVSCISAFYLISGICPIWDITFCVDGKMKNKKKKKKIIINVIEHPHSQIKKLSFIHASMEFWMYIVIMTIYLCSHFFYSVNEFEGRPTDDIYINFPARWEFMVISLSLFVYMERVRDVRIPMRHWKDEKNIYFQFMNFGHESKWKFIHLFPIVTMTMSLRYSETKNEFIIVFNLIHIVHQRLQSKLLQSISYFRIFIHVSFQFWTQSNNSRKSIREKSCFWLKIHISQPQKRALTEYQFSVSGSFFFFFYLLLSALTVVQTKSVRDIHNRRRNRHREQKNIEEKSGICICSVVRLRLWLLETFNLFKPHIVHFSNRSSFSCYWFILIALIELALVKNRDNKNWT